jgi:hypothetical protein
MISNWLNLCLQQLQGWDSRGTCVTFSWNPNWIIELFMNLLVVAFLKVSCTCRKSSYALIFYRIRDSDHGLWRYQWVSMNKKSSDKSFAKHMWLWVINQLWSWHEWKLDLNANAVNDWYQGRQQRGYLMCFAWILPCQPPRTNFGRYRFGNSLEIASTNAHMPNSMPLSRVWIPVYNTALRRTRKWQL